MRLFKFFDPAPRIGARWFALILGMTIALSVLAINPALALARNNLSNIQSAGSFNQTGMLEIDERALEEAVVNALIHRDYSKNAVIRLFIFKDRVEIISPGSLPNHLTIENILNGNSVIRNPTIVSYATKTLPYSGIGSGIPRIIKNHPETKLVNDSDGEQFTITLFRKEKNP